MQWKLQWAAGIPRRISRRWGLALSRGISPYLLQMLTCAPFVTRSWKRVKRAAVSDISDILFFHTSRGGTHLSHLVLAPEAGIMQWCVSVLIGSICVCFALDQLKERETKDYEQNKAGQILFGLYTGMTVNAAKKNHECVSCLWTHTRGIETWLILNSIAAWQLF